MHSFFISVANPPDDDEPPAKEEEGSPNSSQGSGNRYYSHISSRIALRNLYYSKNINNWSYLIRT